MPRRRQQSKRYRDHPDQLPMLEPHPKRCASCGDPFIPRIGAIRQCQKCETAYADQQRRLRTYDDPTRPF